MFIYTISNDSYHDKVLKPSVVTIRRLPNDKEAIHNNIRILIVYRTETRISVTSLKWSSSPARVLTRCWIKGHTCLELVYVKKLFTDERKLKWSPSYIINGLTRCFDEHIYIQKATEFHYLISVFVIGIII